MIGRIMPPSVWEGSIRLTTRTDHFALISRWIQFPNSLRARDPRPERDPFIFIRRKCNGAVCACPA